MTLTSCQLLDHTADFGILLQAPDPRALFELAGRSLFALMITGGSGAARTVRELEVDAEDWADLMVNWLRELLYLWHGGQQVVGDLTVSCLSPTRLRAALATEDFNPATHTVLREIKAVTYHQIEVGPCGQGWCARVIFDI